MLLHPEQVIDAITAAQRAVMKFPYFTEREALEIAKAAVAALPRPSPALQRDDLRRLVDVVWNEATESTAVPSTNWADRLIERAIPTIAVSRPHHLAPEK